jgi:hypothetical protein
MGRLRAGAPLDARDTTLSRERVGALLEALKDDAGRPVLPAADFRGATFGGDASFNGATFGGETGFDDATFGGDASFNGATFGGDASFNGATFGGGTGFDDATFGGDAFFGGAKFGGLASFGAATFGGKAGFYVARFSGDAVFDGAKFGGLAAFGAATFGGETGFDDARFSGDATFDGATFGGESGFDEATFGGDASFDEASFSGDATFRGATFGGETGFDDATFGRETGFDGARFSGDATFRRATFGGKAGFYQATFGRETAFKEARFSGEAYFRRATFSGDATFYWATFDGYAGFYGATFGGYAGFDETTFRKIVSFGELSFERDASFAGAVFERARELARFTVGSRLVLDDCVFLERVRLEVAARVVSARAATFAAGALLRVRWAEIALDEADFARPSTLSEATTWRSDSDLPPVRVLDDRDVELEPRSRLITLRGAHIASLSLSNVDLRACRFFGAHGLESLSIEASCLWPPTPVHWRTRARETIAEEHHWRASVLDSEGLAAVLARLKLSASPGWRDPYTRPPAWLEQRDGADVLEPRQIAALYRSLRKAREDNKDEAGAGDLYYGEMEMRRRDPHGVQAQRRFARARSERAVLTAYFLLAGYGLKAGRALVSLALAIAIGGALLYWFGFHEPRGYGRSLLFALESSISLLRAPETGLSAGGQIVQITLRLLGPLFFGLALLAIRARVKR